MAKFLSRRRFFETTALGAGVLAFSPSTGQESSRDRPYSPPLVISTWKHGVTASRAAMKILQAGGSVLDAVERGINEVERDPEVSSVGVGGLPNEEGEVELDASIMGENLRCGSVMGLRKIATPISVARRVMEKTRHIQLAGAGALHFALKQGFPVAELLTPRSRKRWREWRDSPQRKVPGQVDHDTVTSLALDGRRSLAAGCSTSGLAWKIPGRIGDSPVVGAGIYCDGEVGAAGATGIGEEILRICGSFFIVEMMRAGRSPSEAIGEALGRVARADPLNRKRQVAFIALSRNGEIGAGAMLTGFQAAIATGDGQELLLDVPPWKG